MFGRIALLAIVTLASSSLYADLNASTSQEAVNPSSLNAAAFGVKGTGPLLEGIYSAQTATTVTPIAIMDGEKIELNVERNSIQLEKDEVLSVRFDQGNVIVKTVVGLDDQGQYFDTFIFDPEDLRASGLAFLMPGGDQELVEHYSDVLKTDLAMYGGGNCKVNTEHHLHFWVNAHYASQVTAGQLAKVGFHTASCSNAQMKIWRGGSTGHGHMAWHSSRAKDGWTSGDFNGDPGSGFHVYGCFSRNGTRMRTAQE